MKPFDLKREFFSVKSKVRNIEPTAEHCIIRLFNPNSLDECFIKNIESTYTDIVTILKRKDGVYVTEDVLLSELLLDNNYVLDVLFEPCLIENDSISNLSNDLSNDSTKELEEVVLADGGALSNVAELPTKISYVEYYTLYLDKAHKILSKHDYTEDQTRAFFEKNKTKIEYLFSLNIPIDEAVSIICLQLLSRFQDAPKGVQIFYFKDGKVEMKTQKINPNFTFQENLYEIKKAISESNYYNYICKVKFASPINYSNDSVLAFSMAVIKELQLLENNEFCFVFHKSKVENDNLLLFYSKNTFSTKTLYTFADKLKEFLENCSICGFGDKFSMK